MQFSKDNLPELGQRVLIGDNEKGVQTGIIFGVMQRYELGPLILVDVESINADAMAYNGSNTAIIKVDPSYCRTSF